MNTNMLTSEQVAVVATVDPDAYAVNTYTSDWVDMADFEAIMAVVMAGTMGTAGTVDAKLEQAVTTGGTPKDVTGKAITQLTEAGTDSDKQAIINCRGSELDINGGYRYVRLSITVGDTTSPETATVDAGGVVFGFWPKLGGASASDLASVDEIV